MSANVESEIFHSVSASDSIFQLYTPLVKIQPFDEYRLAQLVRNRYHLCKRREMDTVNHTELDSVFAVGDPRERKTVGMTLF